MKKGFTLLEILLVIAAIGILAAIVIVAINPNRQLSQVRDADRDSSSNTLSNALNQYLIDNGSYPTGVSSTETEVCSTGTLSSTDALGGIDCTGLLDLRPLVPDYVASIPVEPQSTGDGAGYKVFQDSSDTRVFVKPSTVEALSCPDGYIPVPGNAIYGTDDFCVMKYEAQSDGVGGAESVLGGSPWSREQAQVSVRCQVNGAEAINNNEWMTIARNIEGVPSNWTGGAVGSGALYRGHSDLNPVAPLATAADSDPYFGTGNTASSDQRRTFTLTNGEVIWDFAGNATEFLEETIDGADKPDDGGSTAEWPAVTDFGSLSYDQLKPSNATWDSTQNVGTYVAGGAVGTYAYARGGDFQNGGLFRLRLAFDVNTNAAETTFRCVIR